MLAGSYWIVGGGVSGRVTTRWLEARVKRDGKLNQYETLIHVNIGHDLVTYGIVIVYEIRCSSLRVVIPLKFGVDDCITDDAQHA